MADTAGMTPNKRKSFGGKPGSAKKQKLDLNKTPKPATPKQGKVQISAKKAGKKPGKQSPQTNDSPKKLNPFAGTAIMKSPKNKKELKKIKASEKNEPKVISKAEGKKEKDSKMKKRNQYFKNLKERLKTATDQDKKVLVAEIEEKIKNISSRDEISKTGKRKLTLLARYKKSIDGTSQEVSEVESKKLSKQQKNLVQQKKTVQEQHLQKTANGKQQGKKADLKVQSKQKKGNQKDLIKKAQIEQSDEDDSEEDDEEEEEEEDDDDNEVVEEEGEDEEEGDDDQSDEESGDAEEASEEEDDGESEDEDDSDEDAPPLQEKTTHKQQKGSKKVSDKKEAIRSVNLEDLKKSNIISDSKKQRYVLFVGNIPYDTTKQDLHTHFQKCGEIKHIRIPTVKNSNKPRGFAYVEVSDADVYQKCLSVHHTFLKGRRINVLYTTGGKKKSEDKKGKVKVKNLKLQAMRKQGQLAGSVKETNKRSYRRKKQKQLQEKSNNEDE